MKILNRADGNKKHKIEMQFRNLFIVFCILMTGITILVVNFIFGTVSKNVSRDYARFYALEAVNKFNVYLYRELSWIEKIAKSKTLAEWFSDEQNEEKKLAAYDEMMYSADMLSSVALYFTIDGSLNDYAIDKGASIEELTPRAVTNPDDENDKWYFECIISENDYTLNIDADKFTNRYSLWINYKVLHKGEPVGVFCTSLPLNKVVGEIFKQYDHSSTKGIIIDRIGEIQMKSALSGESYKEGYLIHNDFNDTVLLSSLEEYLGKIDTYFTSNDKPVIVEIKSKEYSFATFAPIENTDWTVVTLFNSDSLFSTVNFRPLIVAIFVIQVIIYIVIILLLSRMIFNPLHNLIDSIKLQTKDNKKHIYGYDLQNELGEVSRTIQNMRESIEFQANLFRTIFDSIPDIAICKDLNLNYTQCNKFAEEINGVLEKDIIGKNDIDGFGFPANVAELIMEADRTAIREDRKVIVEEKVTYPDGITRILETVRVPIKQDGIIIGLIAIARDVTQRKESEEAARAASRSKSAFLANMSHEIRTPMNSIIGFSELALDGEIPEKTKEYLDKILENSEWLLQIINDILDISKIESGKMELESIPFDLHELFTACRTLITPKAEEKGIDLHFYAEPSTGRMLLGDPTRLRQVIINILSNAIKFTSTGTVKMAAVIIGKQSNSEEFANSKEFANSAGEITINFEIKDSGIGMTSEQIEKIFEPFAQAEAGTTRKYGGTGLGLTITKNIIDLMGGTLSVESTPGLGSKFSFELTFKTVDIAGQDKPAKIKQIDKPVFDGEVLLCEDNKMNQQVISEHLVRVGLKTVIAENGREGVEAVRRRILDGEKRFDLIFMDIHMPVMDGLEAAAEIIKLNTGTPIIAMTANVMSDNREQYIVNGMSDCIGKPFTSQELWSCLLRHLTPVNASY